MITNSPSLDSYEQAVRLYIITDSLIFRELFALWIDEHCECLVVVGCSGSGRQSFELIERNKPDVILIDFNLINNNGYETCRELIARWPDIKIIAIANDADPRTALRVANIGVAALLNKSITTVSLVDTILTVHFDGKILQPSNIVIPEDILTDSGEMPPAVSANPKEKKLSRREFEILTHITNGETNRDIAKKLEISEHTVRNHISNIFHKLGVRNRTEAAMLSLKDIEV
ncbi:MAG: response regulator transcription factor [bacterium]|nr:response regulator transcription factor [bacterium]